MEVIEQFIQSRSGDTLRCEDIIVLSDDFLALLDGATDEGGPEIDGLPSGLFAARAIARRIAEMPAHLGAEEAMKFLSEVLPGEGGAAKCDVILFSKYRKEVWRVGTIHLLLDGIPYPPSRRIDEITSAGRAALNQALLLQGQSEKTVAENDPGRELMLPLMRMQGFFANEPRSEWGYGTINGRPVPPLFLEIFPTEGIGEIIFASDGYPEVFSSLREAEEALSRRLRDDPLRLRQPGATRGLRPGDVSFDDRAFLRFQP